MIMKELQDYNTKSESKAMPIQQSFIEQTIQELDRIVGLLNTNNERLDIMSTMTGERNYEECKSSCGEVQKSPESRKEIISDLIFIIKHRLTFQEDRILELEKFI